MRRKEKYLLEELQANNGGLRRDEVLGHLDVVPRAAIHHLVRAPSRQNHHLPLQPSKLSATFTPSRRLDLRATRQRPQVLVLSRPRRTCLLADVAHQGLANAPPPLAQRQSSRKSTSQTPVSTTFQALWPLCCPNPSQGS